MVKKLDECRFTLNRLMGKNGVFSERDRKKFLVQRGEEDMRMDEERQSEQPKQSQANQNMLGSNNEYFFNDQKKESGHAGGDAGGNEDDFWYGSPKGGFDAPPQIGGSGEY